ncbi:MAG: peptidoglycan DD-metalloendopeptidase family protein [Deltaproteobacteria bacterium]|nr:peptidoglycan DD-metalloendopeptidase family protein [Deltaproteobacteria bacterium]
MLGVALLLALAEPPLAAEPGFGGEGDQAERERAAMSTRITEDRERVGNLRKEEGSILGALAELDRSLEDQRKRVVELSVSRVRAELAAKAAEAQLAQAKEKLLGERARVAKRAVAMLRLRRTALSELLARAKSPSELRRLKTRLGFALEHDARVLEGVRRAGDDALAAERAATTERSALASRSLELGKALETNESLRKERAALLTAVQRERRSLDRLIGEIASASKRLDAASSVPRGLLPPPPPASGGFGRQKGRLPWPVAGLVEAPFGKRVEPESRIVLDHPGIDIRAPFGEPVHAPFHGRVAFSGAIARFGRAVVLDHGDGALTLYGHLDEPSVAVGDEVAAGDPIGTVGESGSWKGPFLYFEVRKRRTPEDPLLYLAP